MDNQMVPPDDPTLQSSNDISTQVVQSSGDSNPSPDALTIACDQPMDVDPTQHIPIPPPAESIQSPPEPACSVTPAACIEVDASSSKPIQTDPMQADPSSQRSPSPRVLKTIKKTEVEVLCHQHNPVSSSFHSPRMRIHSSSKSVLAAKKAQQQDKIRNALYALPPMSRIKLRVSAGVFEVTLVRVIEETGSVEVLWDRGFKREFKWRSVVFGETSAVVGHKPSEAAPDLPCLCIR